MPQIDIDKNSTEKQINVRFISTVTGLPAEDLTVSSPGLELWYRRDGAPQVYVTPVALSAIDAAHTAGGIYPIDNGYYRFDLPNAALATGVNSLQIGGGAADMVMIGVNVRLVDPPLNTSPLPPDTIPPEEVSCDVIFPEELATNIDGCPLRTKRRHVSVPQGVCGTILWIMRKPNGTPANFSSCLSVSVSVFENDSLSEVISDYRVAVRFQGCDRGCVLAEVDAEVLDSEHGIIQFTLPAEVCQQPGIYKFEAALLRGDSPIFTDSGLISMTPGLWGDLNSTAGPPTIEEVRMHLRDRAEENTLLGVVEFDDAEILDAIRKPVMEFNETPPRLKYYSCNNFPWRFHWLDAIAGNLLMIAVHHYMRNKMLAAGSNLTVDSKNRDTDYLRLAKMYQDNWRLFIRNKKVELNAQLAWGHIN